VDVHKGDPAHVDACGQGGRGKKPDFFVDVINGWPLILHQALDVGFKISIGDCTMHLE